MLPERCGGGTGRSVCPAARSTFFVAPAPAPVPVPVPVFSFVIFAAAVRHPTVAVASAAATCLLCGRRHASLQRPPGGLHHRMLRRCQRRGRLLRSGGCDGLGSAVGVGVVVKRCSFHPPAHRRGRTPPRAPRPAAGARHWRRLLSGRRAFAADEGTACDETPLPPDRPLEGTTQEQLEQGDALRRWAAGQQHS